MQAPESPPMESSPSNANSLFDVYLRLRPSYNNATDCFLDVDEPVEGGHRTHITIKPPTNDHRKRAVERFAFTNVFEEGASQLDLFHGIHVVPMVEGVMGAEGKPGRDALIATLGVTGSGKSHTILGSRTQRGMLQLTLDLLFKSIADDVLPPLQITPELASADVSEAQMVPASAFLDAIYGDGMFSRETSRAATPMMDYSNFCTYVGSPAPRRNLPQLASMPQRPTLENVHATADVDMDYAIIVSMYEVYNDRIFDLLTNVAASKPPGKDLRRRPLLFKPTEYSPHLKVVAGLRKVVCGNLDEALRVLETGLTERRVAGTGSNAVSSRSHGFFCVEVKKRKTASRQPWSSSTLTIVDLAGSERARAANTTGSTLAEAGKINESLMYLGQCMQMQSDNATNLASGNNSSTAPFRQSFRQCKLTELLFANSFPTPGLSTTRHHPQPQKAVMIVTADPRGDFNATSQILRYSALAREVTVPRIPSVTSTILANVPANPNRSRPGTANSSHTPTPSGSWSASGWATTTSSSIVEAPEDMLLTRLQEQLEVMELQLEEERRRRIVAETNWTRAEQRADEIEATVRQECWAAHELEMARYRALDRERWETEQEREAAHLDAKLDAFKGIYEDDDADTITFEHSPGVFSPSSGNGTSRDSAMSARVRELEDHVQSLQLRLANSERAQNLRTPSRKLKPFKTKPWALDAEAGGVENGPLVDS